jgi:hypothetical protein
LHEIKRLCYPPTNIFDETNATDQIVHTEQFCRRLNELRIAIEADQTDAFENELPDNMMVVTDSRSVFAPEFKLMIIRPRIHFGQIPWGYMSSQFSQLPKNYEHYFLQLDESLKQQPDGEYCSRQLQNTFCLI